MFAFKLDADFNIYITALLNIFVLGTGSYVYGHLFIICSPKCTVKESNIKRFIRCDT